MPNLRLSVFLIFVITAISLNAEAQTIKGRVFRAGGDTAVANAIVYYGGSMAGTIADDEGRFELQAKAQQIPITVSCIGYFSSTVNYEAGKPLLVYLKPKLTELKTVTISAGRADGGERKQNERLFIQEFLGISEFAKSCTIVNLNDVDLLMDKKTLTLTATCDKPLIIQNRKLGYVINYYLDNFSRTRSTTHYAGNYIFKEDSTIKSADRLTVSKNRERAYKGSRMQFIRALWHNTLDTVGFTIKNQQGQPLGLSQILRIDSARQKYLYLESPVSIYYNSDPTDKNIVSSTGKYLFIDKNGFNTQGLQWSGRMSDQRVGDLLPFEYQSKNDPVEVVPIANPKVEIAKQVLTVVPSKNPKDEIAAAQKTDGTTIPVFFEKTYLHTDRDTYAQGEDLWFKAYVVNAQSNQSINYSKNLYVELISPAAKIVHRKMLRLNEGLADGDFKLSDTLITGNYRLRAYTNWMRNFGDNFVFEKTIHLVGGLAVPQAGTVTTSQKKKAVKPGPMPKVNPDTLPVVRFFPEGGLMVNGLSSVIAVKAEDENGRGITASGNILDNSGETVASFTCDSLGFGAFTLLPDAAQHYQALVNIRHLPRRFVLPQVSPTGFTMHMQDKQATTIVSISCNEATFAKINGQHIYLTAQHGGKTYVRRSLFIGEKDQIVKLDDNLLAEGINCITITDEKTQPLAERLIYVHHALNTKLFINTDKTVYPPKQPVTVSFKLNMPGVAHLSLAAVDITTVPVQPENIVSYLELQSEVRGHIEQAAKYFDTTNVNRFKQLDLLLLTQGWRGFVWKRIADTTLKFDRDVEQGITLTGAVTNSSGRKGLPNMHVELHAPKAEGDKFFEANTDTAGRFAIYGPVFYGYQYLNFASRNFDNKNKGKSNSGGWIKVDSLSQDPFQVNLVNTFVTDTLPSQEDLLARLNIPKKQQLKEVKIVANEGKFPPRIHAITLADQKDFGNLLQYLLYAIEGSQMVVFVRKDHKTFVNLETPRGNLVRLLLPVYADGSKVDINILRGQDILAMPMSEVINVVLQKKLGLSGFIWSVSISVRPGAFNIKDYFDNTTANMVGYYKAREFYKPKFGEMDDKPDPRINTIHWEPNITTNSNGEAVISFFNALNKGKYRIVAQGVTEDGTPVTAASTYQVR